MPPLANRPMLLAATLLTVCLGAAALSGCQPSTPAAARVPDTLILAGWDTSGSNTGRLADEAEAGARLIRRFDPDHTHLVCYRVDCDCDEFFDHRAPESMEALLELFTTELAQPAKHRGTHPAPFWQEAAERAAAANGPVVVLLHTDGQIDDQSPESLHAYRVAAERLAANPWVRRVALWGVQPDTRAQLRRLLSSLGDRLELCGTTDMNPDTLAATAR